MKYHYRGLIEFAKAALNTHAPSQSAMLRAMNKAAENGMLVRCWRKDSTGQPTRGMIEAISEHMNIAPAVVFIDCYEVKPRDVPEVLRALRRQVSLSVIQKAMEDLE